MLNSEQPKNATPVQGNGATVAFDYPYPLFASTDLKVWFENRTTWAVTEETAGFAIADMGTVGGGPINWRLGARVTFAVAPTSAVNVILGLDLPAHQQEDFEQYGGFPAERVEAALDRPARNTAILKDWLARIPRLHPGDGAPFTGYLPAKELRKGKAAMYDAAGDPAVGPPAFPAALAGSALYMVRVNAGATAYELRSPAQVRADIGTDNASNLTSGTLPDARLSALLQAIAALVPANDKALYFTGAAAAALFDSKAFGRSLEGAVDAAAARALLALGSMALQAAGAVAITGGSITGLAAPLAAADAANKQYVDTVAAGLGTRGQVRAATTANVNLANALENGDTIDGVVLATGNLVLVKSQTAPAENGVYAVPAAGAAARDGNFDTFDEIAGSLIAVNEGTANSETLWLCTSNDGGTLGTTALAFSLIMPGITVPVAVNQGGHGATTAAGGRVNMGFAAALDTLWTAADFPGARTALSLVPGTAANNIVQLDGAAKLPPVDGSQLTNLGSGMPRGHIAGLGLANNGADVVNDIDIAVGAARDDANGADIALASALVKRLDAAWAVGTNQGGLDTGAIANTTYHIWLIKRSDTAVVDVLFSTSASAPTMPTNYDKKRRIGSIVRSGGAIVKFVQSGDWFWKDVATCDIDVTSPGTAAATRTMALPAGVKTIGIFTAHMEQANGHSDYAKVLLTSLETADTAPTDNGATHVRATLGSTLSGAGAVDAASAMVRTNASAQIRSRCGGITTGAIMRIVTHGWIDLRSKED